MKQISKSKESCAIASVVIRKALERAFVHDLAIFKARLGNDEWRIRNSQYALSLEKECLLPMIEGKQAQDFWKERELAVEKAEKGMSGLSQDELHQKRAEIDAELADGRKKAPQLLKEYAASFAGGVESILSAIEMGIRGKLEELVERRDKLATLRDAIDRLIRWPTGPC